MNHERLEKMKAEWSRDLQEPHQEQGREESQQQGNSISQVPEINQAPQRKKQQEEELDQPGKEAGVLEWVCNFESVTKSKAYGTKKGHNDRYHQDLNSVYCR